MKILVLRPIDEQHVFAATAIKHFLPQDLKDNCFAIPRYRQWLIDSKLEHSWEEAAVRALFDSDRLLAALKPQENYILIGNAPSSVRFDAVFSFQDIDTTLPYNDRFLAKIRTIFGKSDEEIYNIIYNLHEAAESSLNLTNCKAAAQFLADYCKSDEPIKEALKAASEKYNRTLRNKLIQKYGKKQQQ